MAALYGAPLRRCASDNSVHLHYCINPTHLIKSPKSTMKTRFCSSLLFVTLVLASRLTLAQPFDLFTFDTTSTGPWSEVGRTTLMVPKVPNGSVVLDGAASSQEYGGFQGVTVTPGNPDGTMGN